MKRWKYSIWLGEIFYVLQNVLDTFKLCSFFSNLWKYISGIARKSLEKLGTNLLLNLLLVQTLQGWLYVTPTALPSSTYDWDFLDYRIQSSFSHPLPLSYFFLSFFWRMEEPRLATFFSLDDNFFPFSSSFCLGHLTFGRAAMASRFKSGNEHRSNDFATIVSWQNS